MKPIIWFSLFLIVFYVSCEKKQIEEELIRPVRYMQVFTSGGNRVRSFSGVAQSGQESRLSFKVPGTLSRLNVKVGDKVSSGDLIAVLDANDYRLRLQQAEAALAQSQALQRNASAAYERVKALYENNNASKQDLDASRAGYESATAAVQAGTKQLELARLQLSYTKINAPFTGAIAAVNGEINENIQAGQPLVTLTSETRLEVNVSLPAVLISRVKENDKVKVKFDVIPDNEFMATIAEVGIASSGYATTYPVTVRLDKQNTDVRAGMVAEVSFTFAEEGKKEFFIVPSVAVGEDRTGRFVFTVEPGENNLGKARKKTVQVGEITQTGLEILNGLEDGDLLVTAGISKIYDGQTVRLKTGGEE